MNTSFNTQNLHKYPKHNKKRLNQEQVKLLEASFNSTKKLELEKKLQTRRARWKNQNLENDYNALQLKLEIALSEKMQLEKETETLRGELQRANEMLSALKSGTQGQIRDFTMSSSYCHEDVISYSTTWVHGDHEVNYNLQFDELYSMIGVEEGSNKCCSTW
ncbi:unnamed protein product [Withania somnifera]